MAHDLRSRPITVLAAIFANLLIAVAKFIVALITNSSAMLAEAIHSVVDTGNELLILYGIQRSQAPPDDLHPFGHGQELYFWTLIVSILLFGMGGGMAIYEGITHIQHPVEMIDPIWNYLVLSIAFLAEGTSWLIALRKLKDKDSEGGILQTFRDSKDPTVFVVVGEDTAALAGILVAGLGIFLSHRLENPYLDGIASLIIGLILSSMAIFLASESKGLLIGESADREAIMDIRHIVETDPAVCQLRKPLTMHFGPEEVLLNMDIEFQQQLTFTELASAIDRIEAKIQNVHPEMKSIFLEVENFKEREQ
jgi:cation diffusion facilitator family transporter